MKKDEPGTRQRILESACRVFAEKGYRGATVADICDAADANIASVNYHFGDKERLYDEVWHYAFTQAQEAHPLDAFEQTHVSPEVRLRSVVMSMLQRTLSKGLPGYYARLQLREMVEPTAALEDMVRDVIIPQRLIMTTLVREILGDEASQSAVDLCVFSVASQVLFLSVSEPVRANLVKQDAFTEPTIAAFADHLTDFSLAGMAGIRKLSEGTKA